MAGSGGSLVTSVGTWTFSAATGSGGNLILLNGQSAAGGSAVELEVANQGNLYADNTGGQWWRWNGSRWTGSLNPSSSPSPSPSPSPSVSPDGSILMAGTGAIHEAIPSSWTFSAATGSGGNLILLNDQSAANGSAVELGVANHGNLYAE